MSTTHGGSDAVLAAGQRAACAACERPAGFTMVPRRGFTPKQALFVAEYPKDCNAAAAARRAGYSVKTADRMGYKLLRKAEISAAVEATVQRHFANLDLSLERIIQEAARVGTSDIGDLFDAETGGLLSVREMPENIRRAISGACAGRCWSVTFISEIVGETRASPAGTLER